MLIPQIKIIQKQSSMDITKEFNRWAEDRASKISTLNDISSEDALRIPSSTHLQWDQGLQHYVLTVVYLATKAEIDLIK
jgi:hypothetical protein